MIYEPNRYHYVTIHSYVYYLQSLGYDVNLLVHESFDAADVLGDYARLVNTIYFSVWNDKVVLDTLFSDEFDLIWVSTLDYGSEMPCIFERFGRGYPHPRHGLFGTIHSLELAKGYGCNYKEFALLGTLSDYRSIAPFTYPISLSFLDGRVSKDGKPVVRQACTPVTFASVGVSTSLAPMMDASSKIRSAGTDYNYSILVCGAGASKAGICKQYLKAIKRSILNDLDARARVTINPLSFHKSLNRFSFVGELTFQKLFAVLTDSDYILSSFEGTRIDRFSTCCTSGATILSLAYAKPMLLNACVAKSWGFTDKECITYNNNNEFYTRLVECIELDHDRYESMRENLILKREQRENHTLEAIAEAADSVRHGKRQGGGRESCRR